MNSISMEWSKRSMCTNVGSHRFSQKIRTDLNLPDALPLSVGTCTLCPSCSCPDAPCRYPERAFNSMEAAGLLVSDVCSAARIPYYHGKGTIAYVSCVLV